ncbi:protein-S-isoprenylcysteine O-methyltransferase Ste14 [Oikeobacillus pervagus]|uniref:Protein-S-isoprenylcysteine O-methyltransferase Ste14 n=1 Tax=Oikeobacillus pervagus TaxID=1325931 RepID=A0AAJ1T4T8_9BACI|nr:hypothetical protein [Oikeobacillus pervagus]MDQ0214820.1 protein-S-isoprenylcysteine O-methyltransferase Ste14 [Oikeobacillus pervagus]
MSTYMMILSLLVLLIAAIGFVYTLKVTRLQKTLKGNQDTAIPKDVQEGAYKRNPIFLSYIIGFGALLLFILYLFFKFY